MKISLTELRAIIREEAARLTEGSWQVDFTEKNGQPGKPRVFGDEKMANMYAKTVKNGKVSPVDAAAPAVTAREMPAAGLDDLKASAKKYYDKHWNPKKGSGAPGPWRKEQVSDSDESAEHRGEIEAEMWAAGRAAGQSAEDTWLDIDAERMGRTRRSR